MWKILTAVIAATILPLAAFAAIETPNAALTDASTKIKTIVSKNVPKGTPAEAKMKEDVRTVVSSFLDYKELAKRSMGKHWADLTDAQKTEFTGLLRDLIEASYLNKISGNADYKMEIVEEADEGGEPLVVAKLSAKGGVVNVGFKLHNAGGKWLCFDLLIDEVSTMRNYRGEFNKIIKDQGYPALVKRMKDKLVEVKAKG